MVAATNSAQVGLNERELELRRGAERAVANKKRRWGVINFEPSSPVVAFRRLSSILGTDSNMTTLYAEFTPWLIISAGVTKLGRLLIQRPTADEFKTGLEKIPVAEWQQPVGLTRRIGSKETLIPQMVSMYGTVLGGGKVGKMKNSSTGFRRYIVDKLLRSSLSSEIHAGRRPLLKVLFDAEQAPTSKHGDGSASGAGGAGVESDDDDGGSPEPGVEHEDSMNVEVGDKAIEKEWTPKPKHLIEFRNYVQKNHEKTLVRFKNVSE